MDPILIKMIAVFLIALHLLHFEGDQQHPASASTKVNVSIRYRKRSGRTYGILKPFIIVQLNKAQNKQDIQKIQFSMLSVLPQRLRKWKANKGAVTASKNSAL